MDIKSLASKYFTWAELTYLPTWQIYHIPNEQEIENLTKLAQSMDIVRDFLEKPINVHCAIRPQVVKCPGSPYSGRNYNAVVGGAMESAHIRGLAMDYSCSGVTCDEIRFLLLEKLPEFKLRMENRPGSLWVHNDLMPPNPNRFFKP